MAFSSSIKRAQTIKLCELCNEDNIKWRCVDCEMCFCEKCKTFHLKVPVTAKHQIVTIATPIQDIQRKIVTDNIPCKDHGTRMSCLFCKTCDCLVCPECVSTSHTNHKFIPIEQTLDNKLKQLKGKEAKVIDSLKLCDSKTTEIQHLMPKYNAIFDESVTKIKQKERELKEAISKCSQILQDKVEVERSKVKTGVTKAGQQIDGVRKKLNDLKHELETALTSNQGQVIFEITPIEPTVEFDSLPPKVENFIPVAKETRQIIDLFGSFKEVTIPTVTIPTVQPEFGFEVLKTFTTDLPAIHKVLSLDETSAWITCGLSTKPVIRKVTIQDNNIVILSEITILINDITKTYDNDILLIEGNKSDVKLMTKSGEIKPFLTLVPLFPCGIHVTSDNKVMVGVREPGNVYTPNDKSQRAVMVYGMDGKQQCTYQYDKNGRRLFTGPIRITTNNNQDKLVIDRTAQKTGRVVTLNREGNLRWIYEGHPKINETIKFCPVGITTTESYIIINDLLTHALHVLSENGEVLTCKVMGDLGIMYPFGLNIDKGGKLWVGCNSGKDSGAKLHIVKLLI